MKFRLCTILFSSLLGFTSKIWGAPLLHSQDIQKAPLSFGSPPSVSTFSANGSLSLANNATLTLTGPNATVVTGSSVTASSFYGSGTGVTNMSVHYTSMTVIDSTTTSVQNFAGGCIVGSTITVTTNATRAKITYSGLISNSATGSAAMIGFEEDGVLIDGQTNTRGMCTISTLIGGSLDVQLRTCSHIIQNPLGAGTHSYCIVVGTLANGNTSTIGGLGGANNKGDNSFFVYEQW